MEIKENIIQLDNGEEYVVVDTISFSNRNFLLAGKVLNEQEIDDLKVFEMITNDDSHIIIEIKDEQLCEKLYQIFNGDI